MSCDIAELNELITIQRYVEVDDGSGGRTSTLVDIDNDPQVWAKVIVLSGKEQYTHDRTEAVARYQFRILNRSDLDESMVIVWNNRVFNIVAVLYRSESDFFLHVETELGKAV
ncbi:MAG: head-tail adaptor protein [Chloroflexi bacterium]|nr:MAG: head-tail adaptor protein [Chloroflexota bacterium]